MAGAQISCAFEWSAEYYIAFSEVLLSSERGRARVVCDGAAVKAAFGLGVGGGVLHDCLGRFPLKLEAVASEESGGFMGILHKLTGSDTLSLGLTDQLEGAINAGFCIELQGLATVVNTGLAAGHNL